MERGGGLRGAAADQVIEQIGVIDMVTKLVWMIAAIPIAGVGMKFAFC